MGMSASQMRYALISGKKNDVEFQGQQINQQRTQLATQSSACNSQLLDLEVPTPPSSSDFSTTSYTFKLNGNQHKFDSKGIEYIGAGKYDVHTTYTTKAIGAKSSVAKYINDGTYYYAYISGSGTQQPRQNILSAVDLSDDTTTDTDDAAVKTARANMSYIDNDYLTYMTANPGATAYTNAAGDTYTWYQDSSSTPITYVRSDQMDQSFDNNSNTPYYYVTDDVEQEVSNTIVNATIEWSSSGRLETITDESGQKYSVSISTVKDDDAFNDAYQEWQYQKNLYDDSITEINAKMDIIQAQDKQLELKLQDLDTQQEALATEMDSVKKVIDKNIESSFKAFA